MGMRTEKLKTVILCEDREFKNFAVNNLNNAALPGEKFTTEEVKEAHQIIESNGLADNFLVDFSGYSKKELVTKLNEVFPLPTIADEMRRVITIVMLDPEEHMQLAKALNQKFKDVFFFYMPMTQQQFIEGFHDGRKNRVKITSSKPQEATSTPGQENKKNTSSVNFLETTKHIRSSIESLNNIAKDDSRVDDMQHIGQRFNGMIGAFAFYGKKSGYHELHTIATYIDNICRIYENDKDKVDKSHFDIVLLAARTAFLLLKDLREGNELSPKNKETLNSITESYNKLSDVKERNSQSQQDVDALIDSLAQG